MTTLPKARLLEFGVCQVEEEEKERNEESPTGYFLRPNSITFTETADDEIRIREGVAFGIKYYLEADNLSWPANFYSKIIYPLLVNPLTVQAYSETIEEKCNFYNQEHFDYYRLEYQWEMQPGEWIFQVIQQEVVLVEKIFKLIR
jgi:hypothetical protein